MRDIQSKEDIGTIVNSFYQKVILDDVIGPFFKHFDFETHIPKMIHFWSFVLLEEPGYTTNVTEKHMKMPLKQIHFDRWIALFSQTVDDNFQGLKSETAKQRAILVGWTMLHKIENK